MILKNFLKIFIFVISFITNIAIAKANDSLLQENLTNLEQFLITTIKHNYPNSKINITINNPRILNKQCHNNLNYKLMDKNIKNRMTVAITCNSDISWKIQIPVYVNITQKVVAINKAISKGSVITANDLILIKTNLLELSQGFFSDIETVANQVIKTSLRSGTILQNNHLQPPIIIKKGELVTIIAKQHGIIVKSQGKALENGTKKSQIVVMNLKSKKNIFAFVYKPGIVKTHL